MKKSKKIIGLIILTFSFVLAAFQYLDTNPAVNFLNSLNVEQREKTQLAFGDESKEIWHFFPGKIWPRPGIQLSELNSNQRDLLFKLLRTYLSETGYNKTRKIMDLENVLLELGDNIAMRDVEKYHMTFYGDPTKDKLWAWSYEGHHVSLNFTNLNDKITIAPHFFGASLAIIPSGKRKNLAISILLGQVKWN